MVGYVGNHLFRHSGLMPRPVRLGGPFLHDGARIGLSRDLQGVIDSHLG